MASILKYYLDKELNTPVNHWVFEFIAHSLGLVSQNIDSREQAHILYLEESDQKKALTISVNTEDVIHDDLLNNDGEFTSEWLTFDYVNAIKSFLLDDVNQSIPKSGYDAHNRLNSLDSFQAKKGYQLKAVVNCYINYLGDHLRSNFGLKIVAPVPEGKKGVIILSHDVDDPQKYSLLETYSLIPKNLSIKKWSFYQLEAVKKMLERIIKRDAKVYWAFDEVMNEEAKHGFTSTFFFAPVNRFQKGANFMHDIPYETSSAEFKAVFKKMNESNFEVGLHTSYYARKGKEQISKEVEKLKSDSGKELVGNRHHFWQIGPNPEETLIKHSNAGLKYDSSMAFNDAPGYRRSVALPFKPFDTKSEKVIDIFEVPTFMMDSNFLKNPEFPEDQALSKAIDCIEEFCKTGGVGAIDWHVRTSYPKNKRFKKWGEVYVGILEYLSKREDIWVTNFETYVQWLEKRNVELHKNSKNMSA